MTVAVLVALSSAGSTSRTEAITPPGPPVADSPTSGTAMRARNIIRPCTKSV